MKRNRLGRTDLEVSELSLGGVFIAADAVDPQTGVRTVVRAAELGVNFFDVAPTYDGSERVLGRALRAIAAPVVVATKLGGRPHPFDPRSAECLERSVATSLELLDREVIDLLLIHEADRSSPYDWWPQRETFRGPVTEVLDRLKSAGTIRYAGVAGTTAYEMAHLVRAGSFDVVLTAFQYSLLWREAEHELLPAAVERGVGVVVGSPLQQGVLAQRRDAELAAATWMNAPRRAQLHALYALAAELGMSVPELALRFVVSNPAVATVLSGARSPAEIEANVAAVERGPLPADVLERLDEIHAMVPFRPYGEPPEGPFARPR